MSVAVAQAGAETSTTQSTEAPKEEAAKAEAPESPAAQAKESKDQLSPRFAALARKEKEARAKLKAAKGRESELAKRESTLRQLEAKVSEFKANPILALKELGWTYADLTNFVLNENKPTPEQQVKSVEEKIEAFRREQEEKEKKRQDLELQKTQQEVEQTISDFKGQITEFIASNPDQYELITIRGKEDLIFNAIDEHYLRTKKAGAPRVLSIKESADLVEKYLENEETEVFSKSKKLKSKLAPAPEAKKESESQPAKTLSNSMTASNMTANTPARTEAERIQRALAALEGNKS